MRCVVGFRDASLVLLWIRLRSFLTSDLPLPKRAHISLTNDAASWAALDDDLTYPSPINANNNAPHGVGLTAEPAPV